MSTPAYVVVRVEIQDWDAYREYMRHSPRVISKFGGKFLARGAAPETLEGEKETLRMVILEFPSIEQARAFYASDEYLEIKKIRIGAGSAQFIALDGYPLEQWEKEVEASHQLKK